MEAGPLTCEAQPRHQSWHAHNPASRRDLKPQVVVQGRNITSGSTDRLPRGTTTASEHLTRLQFDQTFTGGMATLIIYEHHAGSSAQATPGREEPRFTGRGELLQHNLGHHTQPPKLETPSLRARSDQVMPPTLLLSFSTPKRAFHKGATRSSTGWRQEAAPPEGEGHRVTSQLVAVHICSSVVPAGVSMSTRSRSPAGRPVAL